MKIYCHDGIAPSVEVLNQYGIRIQDEFKIVNENGRDAYIIELPENLRLVHKGNLPQIISQFF